MFVETCCWVPIYSVRGTGKLEEKRPLNMAFMGTGGQKKNVLKTVMKTITSFRSVNLFYSPKNGHDRILKTIYPAPFL